MLRAATASTASRTSTPAPWVRADSACCCRSPRPPAPSRPRGQGPRGPPPGHRASPAPPAPARPGPAWRARAAPRAAVPSGSRRHAPARRRPPPSPGRARCTPSRVPRRDAGRRLGAALAMVCTLLDPAMVVVGGELAHAGEILMGPLREVLRARAMPGRAGPVPVELAMLGDQAEVRGALALAVETARVVVTPVGVS